MFDLSWLIMLIIYAVVVAAAVTLLLGRSKLPRPLLTSAVVLIPLLAMAVAVAWSGRVERRVRSFESVLAATPDYDSMGAGYVTSDSCRACHPAQYASWHDSYHRSMTQHATPAAVIGDPRRDLPLSRGQRFAFDRVGDEFWAEMVDPAWEREAIASGYDPLTIANPPRVRKRIVMTTGSHHQQTYWVASEHDGKLFNFPFTWLREDQKWVPREDVFLRSPEFGPARATWHDNCIECHSTAGEQNHDPSRTTYEPSVAELGIACEACHGPADEHIRANQDPKRRYRLRMLDEPDPTIVNPARLPAPASAQVCGQCHALNVFKGKPLRDGVRYRPGGDLTETRISLRTSDRNMTAKERADWPLLQRHVARQSASYIEDRMWPDGKVRVSGRQYNALIESECFKGEQLSCLSCHSMHESDPNDQLAAGMSGNEACLQCHESYRGDIPAHSHHAAESSGSACLNCHMPHTVYGLMMAIRSHEIDSPSVAASLATGRPDACSLCHLDQSLGWVADHLTEWYDQPDVALTDEQESISAAVLWLLTGDANQRALIAWHMGWEPAVATSGRDWMAPYLAHLLDDPYSCVRYIANRSLRRKPNFEQFAFDYIASLEEQSRARRLGLERWRMMTEPLDRSGPSILMTDDRMLDLGSFTSLVRRRNDRVVDLRE